MRRPKSDAIAWHIFSRGARRLSLFRDDEDYLRFLSSLRAAVAISGCLLWAYTLMTNHYHFILYGTTEQITACMRRINQWYSLYHNEKYHLTGHAFDGPYQAYRIKSILLLLYRIAYVFLNPVVAGIVKRAEDYRWSCYRSYLNVSGSPLAVDATAVLLRADPDLNQARKRFIHIINQEAQTPRRRSTNPISAKEVNMRQFEWLLEHARTRKNELDGERPTVVAMYWANQCGVTPKAIAACLGESQTGRLRQWLWRFMQKLKAHPELALRVPLP